MDSNRNHQLIAKYLHPGRGPILLIASAVVMSSTLRLLSQRVSSQSVPPASRPSPASSPGTQESPTTQPATQDAAPTYPILRVRSLADTGPEEKLIPWTLRWALDAVAGPRSIRFETGGVINLKQPLYVRDPYVHVDGRTTDGRGITIQRSQFGVVETHDVLIEHMRFRAGDGFASKDELWRDHRLPDSGGWRSLLVIGSPKRAAHHVTVRHCSIENSSDDNGSCWGNCRDIVFYYCIFAGGHNRNTKAFLGGADPGEPPPDDPRWLTLDHCLLTETNCRAPDLHGGLFRLVNCAMVAPGQGARLTYARGDVIANWLVSKRPHTWPHPDRVLVVDPANTKPRSLYCSGNWLDGAPAPDRLLGVVNQGETDPPPELFSDAPLRKDPCHPDPPEQAIRDILDRAGCLPRDEQDRALIDRVRERVERMRPAKGPGR